MNDLDQKKIFSKNLNYYLSLNNKTQKEAAEAINVSPQTFNTWCQGIALPRMGKVQRLADYFGIGKSDLIDDKSDLIENHSKKAVTINVLNRIASDFQVHATENIVDTTEISAEMAKSGEYFALKVNDDSMAPDICKDDIVIVRQQNHADDGDIVITITDYDKEATCRRLSAYARGIALISNNHNYKPMTFSDDEIKSDDNPMKIIGKAVELRRKL